MDPHSYETTIRICLQGVRARLEKAAGIARTVDACLHDGNIKMAIEIARDIEAPINEANTFLDAARMIDRYRDD